jgi:hypothetical protein
MNPRNSHWVSLGEAPFCNQAVSFAYNPRKAITEGLSVAELFLNLWFKSSNDYGRPRVPKGIPQGRKREEPIVFIGEPGWGYGHSERFPVSLGGKR